MSHDDGRYARFYYTRFIREFPDVYADDAAFAAWMRLLVTAEQMWPMPAELPRSIRPRVLRTLVEAELVTVNGTHFTVRGLDAERTRRSNAGRKGAAVRWDSEGNANAYANAMPSRSISKDEQSTPPPQVGRRNDGTNPRALGTNPRANGTSPRQERQAQKRGPSSLHEILTKVAKGEAS